MRGIAKLNGVLGNANRNFFSSAGPEKVLRVMGIETSRDDTGVAIVGSDKKIYGDSLVSQLRLHLRHGMIIPAFSKHLHEVNIGKVTDSVLNQSGLSVRDLDAIAVTTKPGLPLSLPVGIKFAKRLCTEFGKPLIPVHQLEAHVLSSRMLQDQTFPYAVLLISATNCVIGIVHGINKFQVLGTTLDDAPGDVLNRVARRLHLNRLPGVETLPGGAAIEHFAKEGDFLRFKFPKPVYNYRNCDWKFNQIRYIAFRHILREEREHGLDPDDLLPSYPDLCASVQFAVIKTLCSKVQRALMYMVKAGIMPKENRQLVVTGGVALNETVGKAIKVICNHFNWDLVISPKRLCTANGIVVAWNGVEKLRAGVGIVQPKELDTVESEPKCPLGESLKRDIHDWNIDYKKVFINPVFERCLPQSQEVKANQQVG